MAAEFRLASATVLPAGVELQINTYTGGDQRAPAVASDADGDCVIVWHGDGADGSDLGVFAQRYRSDGVRLGTELQVNTFTNSFQVYPAVAATPAGDFVVVWESYGQDGDAFGVFGQRYSADGVALGTEFQINTYTSSSQRTAAVAADSDGNFVVVWASGSALVGQDGSYFGIFGQRYDSHGNARGTEFQINTYTTDFQYFPELAVDADGDFVVVWHSVGQDGSETGVFGQRYSSSGDVAGSEFRVNTYTTSYQGYAAVAADPEGNFVVVWDGYTADGDEVGVRGQRYASSGIPVGTEFQVNTHTTSTEGRPGIAMSANGDFVVAWASFGQDGDGFGMFGQRFDSGGAAIGTEFQINSYTLGTQWNVGGKGVASDVSGDLVLVWESEDQDGSGFGIFGQRYADACDALPCDDDNRCTVDSCDPLAGCINEAAPATGCKTAVKSLLLLKQNGGVSDKLLFKWSRGEPLAQAELADPTATAQYDLCIYGDDGNEVIIGASIPPSPTSWSPLADKGYRYSDAAGAQQGITSVVLQGNPTSSKSKVAVKGRGANLADPTLGSLTLPVKVQLVNSDTGVCVEATFDSSGVKRHDSTQLKAKDE